MAWNDAECNSTREREQSRNAHTQIPYTLSLQEIAVLKSYCCVHNIQPMQIIQIKDEKNTLSFNNIHKTCNLMIDWSGCLLDALKHLLNQIVHVYNMRNLKWNHRNSDLTPPPTWCSEVLLPMKGSLYGNSIFSVVVNWGWWF